MDFFLKNEQIAIEIKMARQNRDPEKIRNELIIDKEHYRKRKDVKTLYCMVYDPKELIANPRGFENDLSENREDFKVKIFVVPRKV
ncbi:TPA: hypothetical protein EYP75_05210 [Candidatus Bathyarchaeota archaeon]|nr:hypothetical protein [Candidatus Bathyarchaeota archaeon]